MNFTRLLVANLFHYLRSNLAIVLGVAAATSVLTGALLVGDSVRGSLQTLALDRLGRIDELLVADRFFRESLVTDLRQSAAFAKEWSQAEPVFLFPSGTLDTRKHGDKRRASGVLIIGCLPSFWDLSDREVRPAQSPAGDEIVLNQALADELGVQVGDLIAVRMSKLAQIPADSPLGRKTDQVQALPNLKVTAILPVKSLASFSLQPQQGTARVAFVPLPALQQVFEQPEKVNAILVAGKDAQQPPNATASAALQAALKPQLGDLGLQLKRVQRTFGELDSAEVIFDYYSLSSDRMMIEPEIASTVAQAWKQHQPVAALTYLANSIQKASESETSATDKLQEIPYSTITAIANLPAVSEEEGPTPRSLQPGEIALTTWAADDLQAKVGDAIRVTYFEPESTHGEEQETTASFQLAAIVPLTEPTQPYRRRNPAVFADRPTAANDPDFTPEVPGITDQESINSWDPPFPYDQKRVRPKDDDYWKNHRTTPKAYLSVADGERLWGSRFGNVTSFRVAAAEGITAESLSSELLDYVQREKLPLGLEFRPVKRSALAAAAGTTPFDVLFLALSMFIIAAALLLVWLLYRLSVEQRASQIGLLQALGWSADRVLRLQLAEGMTVAALGAALGVAGGIAYAALMLVGLRTWWIGAVTSPFLTLHLGLLSLILGFFLGLVMAVATIWLSVRGLRNFSLRQLLAGKHDLSMQSSRSGGRNWLALGLLVTAVLLLGVAFGLQGEAQGGAALSSGAAFLSGWLLFWRGRWQNATRGLNLVRTLPQLSASNASRNPTRSLATMSLIATAAFLIIAVSAFRLTPTEQGIGGFDYFAESAEPIVPDLNRAAGRKLLLGDAADAFGEASIFGFRVQPGDDASCRNLYRPTQPRVLGVTEDFINHYVTKPGEKPLPHAFRFAGSAAASPAERHNPWKLLAANSSAAGGDAIPVILDKNTAMYSLRLYRGIGEEFDVQYQNGQRVKFRVVGLLAESLLQGSLLIREEDFVRLFPRRSGYQFFLLDTRPVTDAHHLVGLLEDRLGDEGFDISDSRVRLSELFAVQNTYISTFQSLGGLGLLLGTFGLAAVQLRNILERRGELALLRAVGFPPGRLLQLVLGENLVLLAGGLGSGLLAAIFAVLPQLVSGAAQLPWRDLGLTLGLVAVVGSIVSWIAARGVQRAPVVAALRGD